MAFDIEAHINCASFTPATQSPVCGSCPSSTACYGDIEVVVNHVHRRPAHQQRVKRHVLSLPRARTHITVTLIDTTQE